MRHFTPNESSHGRRDLFGFRVLQRVAVRCRFMWFSVLQRVAVVTVCFTCEKIFICSRHDPAPFPPPPPSPFPTRPPPTPYRPPHLLHKFRRGLKNLQYMPPLILSKRKWDKYVVRGGFTSADLKVDRSAFRELMLAALSRYHCRLVAAAVAGMLRGTTPPCNILQYTATHCNILRRSAIHCNTLPHTATHCTTLHHTATHYNTLQHTATHCNTHICYIYIYMYIYIYIYICE